MTFSPCLAGLADTGPVVTASANILPCAPTVEIRNGTNQQGLAGQTMITLTTHGYPVIAVGNAQDFLREQSKVYVLNHAKLAEGEELAKTLNIPVGLDLPAGERASSADILVVLGYD